MQGLTPHDGGSFPRNVKDGPEPLQKGWFSPTGSSELLKEGTGASCDFCPFQDLQDWGLFPRSLWQHRP